MLVWLFVLSHSARGDYLITDSSSVKKCFAVSPGLLCETLTTGLRDPADIVLDGGGGYVIADTGNGVASCGVLDRPRAKSLQR